MTFQKDACLWNYEDFVQCSEMFLVILLHSPDELKPAEANYVILLKIKHI